jgi:dihydroorotate dehydrogenase
MALADLAVPLLQRFPPETAHRLAMASLRAGWGQHQLRVDPRLASTVFGRHLAHPIGLAAGFDKDAIALKGLAGVGFSLIEAGTVTRRAQPGNPAPRLFRLRADQALINRMGFNNHGIEAFKARFAAAAQVPGRRTMLGANLGINKDAADPLIDYPFLVQEVARDADYITINVSSPNTPGLRDWQRVDRLGAIIGAISQNVPMHPPLLVKLAPDLDEAALPDLVAMACEQRVAGLIVSNTTLARPESLRGFARHEAGGLSGAPLFNRSTRMLAKIHLLAGDRLVLIGAGGIATPAQAFAKLRAGASLVQLYTSFVYQGPAVIGRIVAGLPGLLEQYDGERLTDIIGRDADRLAELAP